MRFKTKLIGVVTFRNGNGTYDRRKIPVTSTHPSLLNLTKNDLLYWHEETHDVVDDTGKVIEANESKRRGNVFWINATLTGRKITFDDNYASTYTDPARATLIRIE